MGSYVTGKGWGEFALPTFLLTQCLTLSRMPVLSQEGTENSIGPAMTL